MEEALAVVAKKLAEKEGLDEEMAKALASIAEEDETLKRALGTLGVLGESLQNLPQDMQQQIAPVTAMLLAKTLSGDGDITNFAKKLMAMKVAFKAISEDEDGKKKIDDDNVYKMLYSELKEELKEYRKQYEEALKKLDELKDELEKKELEREKEELLEVIRKQEEYIKTLEDKIEQLEDVLRNPPKPVEEEKPKSFVDEILELKQKRDMLMDALEQLGFKIADKEEPDIEEMIRKLQRLGYDIKAPQMTLQELQKKLEEERERAKKEAFQEVNFMEKILNTVLGHVRPIAEKFIEEYSRAYAEVKKEEAKLKLLALAQQIKQQQAQAQAVNNMNVNNVGGVGGGAGRVSEGVVRNSKEADSVGGEAVRAEGEGSSAQAGATESREEKSN